MEVRSWGHKRRKEQGAWGGGRKWGRTQKKEEANALPVLSRKDQGVGRQMASPWRWRVSQGGGVSQETRASGEARQCRGHRLGLYFQMNRCLGGLKRVTKREGSSSGSAWRCFWISSPWKPNRTIFYFSPGQSTVPKAVLLPQYPRMSWVALAYTHATLWFFYYRS